MNLYKAWRLILPQKIEPDIDNISIDYGIFHSKDSKPTLRFYLWDKKTISIGRLQKIEDFIYKNLPIIKRPTGGYAVIHNKDLCYSIKVEKNQLNNLIQTYSIKSIYRFISNIWKQIFFKMGFDILINEEIIRNSNLECFKQKGFCDLFFKGEKISAASMAISNTKFLIEGTIDITKLPKFDFQDFIDKVFMIFENNFQIEKISDEEKKIGLCYHRENYCNAHKCNR